jgi:hypothetical protein
MGSSDNGSGSANRGEEPSEDHEASEPIIDQRQLDCVKNEKRDHSMPIPKKADLATKVEAGSVQQQEEESHDVEIRGDEDDYLPSRVATTRKPESEEKTPSP